MRHSRILPPSIRSRNDVDPICTRQSRAERPAAPHQMRVSIDPPRDRFEETGTEFLLLRGCGVCGVCSHDCGYIVGVPRLGTPRLTSQA